MAGLDPLVASVDRHRVAVARLFLQALREAGSPLVQDQAMRRQLREQVTRILDETMVVLRDGPEALVAESDVASVEIGTQRARHGIQPIESMRAASVLFQTALTTIAAGLSDTGQVTRLALALEHACLRRVGLVASSYFTHLLDRVHASHAESDLRLARELHDQVAHTLAVALRDVELYETYRPADHERAEVKLAAAKAHLQEAIDTVRALATRLRTTETGEGLQGALLRYLATAPPSVITTVTVSGDEARLPFAVREELYLMLREAIGNALRHAAPRAVTVHVRVREPEVEAVVVDDGHGFDEALVRAAAAGTGLASMAQRAHRVGGSLDVDSQAGYGSIVRFRVPLPRRSS
jgi:signal transduction histidine kinase